MKPFDPLSDRPFDLSLYLVLDPDLCRGYGMVETAMAALRGGATMIQLRDKTGGTQKLIETGRALKMAMQAANNPARLIINDDVDAAMAIDADGLHIGQDDIPPAIARQMIGPDRILGLSVETPAALARLNPAIVDYAGIGPVFATTTKPGHKPATGIDGMIALHRFCPVPAVAIGGIKEHHIPEIIASGMQGVAVVSAICGQPDPQSAAQHLAQAITATRRA